MPHAQTTNSLRPEKFRELNFCKPKPIHEIRKNYTPRKYSGSIIHVATPIRFAVVAVILYHFGCLLEFALGIKDTAKVVPVHGIWYVKPAIYEL